MLILPIAQDHKRAYNNDEGPNTGGMGAYAPVDDLSDELLIEIRKTVLLKCLKGMEAEGRPFIGVLFAGLMLTEKKNEETGEMETTMGVLEYNCRFGDPETQAVMPLIEGDLYQALKACTQNRLDQIRLHFSKGFCCAVVMASGGYPGAIEKNKPIFGLNLIGKMPSTFAFHAGTKCACDASDNSSHRSSVVTSGGRVLAIAALARTMDHAARLAYLGVDTVRFEKAHFRTDIAGYTEFVMSPAQGSSFRKISCNHGSSSSSCMMMLIFTQLHPLLMTSIFPATCRACRVV